jgi:periplasmic protein TonB
MFEQLVESTTCSSPGERPLSFMLAVMLHITVLGILILVTPLFPEALPGALRSLPALVAPPPPPGLSRPLKRSSVQVFRGTVNSKHLTAPSWMPSGIRNVVEPIQLGSDTEDIPTWNVPFGSEGGIRNGFWGGIRGGDPRESPYLPPLPPPETRPAAPPIIQRLAVGGEIQMARLIHQTMPLYPPLARQARIQGIVILSAVIAPNGSVEDLRVISGHPLLVPAALDAVRSWRYRPTLLNGQPASVETTITVNFLLNM